MEINHKDPIAGFIDFTKESLDWCDQESSKSVSAIMDVMDQLVKESSRISAMSEQTLEAIKKIKTDVLADDSCPEAQKVKKLAKELYQFSQQHQEIKDMVSPIIQCLQFQDRLSQNLKNLVAITDLWWQNRQTEAWMKGSDENLVALGEQLLKLTTMAEERKIIQKHIPMLPEQEEEEANAFFF